MKIWWSFFEPLHGISQLVVALDGVEGLGEGSEHLTGLDDVGGGLLEVVEVVLGFGRLEGDFAKFLAGRGEVGFGDVGDLEADEGVGSAGGEFLEVAGDADGLADLVFVLFQGGGLIGAEAGLEWAAARLVSVRSWALARRASSCLRVGSMASSCFCAAAN